MYLSWIIALAISFRCGHAFYHDSWNTYKHPGLNDDALFGFSVSSMATGPKSKLIVGAPKQDIIGGVFTCDPSTQVCSPVSRDGINKFIEDNRYINQGYWLGATVSGTKDFYVACAPRFIAKKKFYNSTYVGIFGKCYSYKDSSASPMLLSPVPKELLETNTLFEQTMQTFGWTLNIDSEDSIYVGGPGMASGRLIRIKSNKLDGYTYGDFSRYKASFNFGYSVTTGDFKPNSDKPQQVAVGSTYGSDGHGKVIFRPWTDITKPGTNQLVGPTVGSMYGAALCTASFSKDGKRSALLVGAPAFADYDGYNTGAVYVYTAATKNGVLKNPITMFPGEASNSFFGSAILNVGDLNGDQKDEIAIAAPYFGDTGCVYLYSGADLAIEGNKPVPLQKIIPSSSTRTFGYSLGLLKDFDDNGCNELVIGAPQSNEVTVLRCIAVITVKLMKLPNAITKSKGDETKTLQVCLNIQFPVKPEKVNAEINVEIAVSHDGASLQVPADGRLTFMIDQKKNSYCQDIELFLKGTGKYNKEIFYTMKATHEPSSEKGFRPENVNLSVKSELSVEGLIWAQECGKGVCLPKLAMTATYSEKSPYVIGSTSSIDAKISVVNSGDVAYDTCVHITVTEAEITKLPINCRELESDILECRPQQPVYNEGKWEKEISFDTSSLTNKNSLISITMTLYNECGNVKTIIDKQEKEFQLTADADSISVQGRTDEGVDSMVNLTRDDIAAHKQFHHVYTIGNSGPTNWVNVPISVTVPKLDIVNASVYLNNIKCDLMMAGAEDMYSCTADSISKDTSLNVEVHVIFTVVSDKLNAKIENQNVTVSSKIRVKLNGELKAAEVISELRLIEGVVPIWIIIAASILAFLILVIIFFILRECGCLKRKNKEELKRVRMSVRRQTMMRKSMMARPPSADQETLVREAEASNDSDKKKKDRRVIINDF